MKRVLKKSLSVVAIAMLLAGCGKVSSTSPEVSSSTPKTTSSTPDSSSGSSSSSSSEWIEEGTNIKLTDTMIVDISGSNLTLEGRYNQGSDLGTTPYGLQVKYTNNAYRSVASTMAEDMETSVASPMTTSAIYYKNTDGYIAYPHNPDKNNQTETTTSLKMEQSVYVNALGGLSADWFAYDSSYVGAGYKFIVSKDNLADKTVLVALTNILDSVGYSSFGGSTGTFSSGFPTEFALYTDGTKITGLGETIVDTSYFEVYGVNFYTYIYLGISDVGTTVINLDNYKFDAYTVPSGEETYYAALGSAITKMGEQNYTGNLVCKDDSDRTVQVSKYEVTADGYSSTEKGTTYDDDGVGTDTNTYYGTHKVGTNIDYYQGSAATALVGKKHVSSTGYNLPLFDFAKEIWDYQSTKDGVYTFKLREDFLKHYYGSSVATQLSNDSFVKKMDDDLNITLTVNSNGTFAGFSLGYVINEIPYSFDETFTNFGTTTITSDCADFTNYTAFVLPTTYAELSIKNITTKENETMDTSLKSIYGDTVGATVPYFMDEEIYGVYIGGVYSPSQKIIQLIYSVSDTSFKTLKSYEDKINTAMTAKGFTFGEYNTSYYSYEGTGCSGAVAATIFIDSNYLIRVQFSIPA